MATVIGRRYELVVRSRGLSRYGAQDLRSGDVIWCLTRRGAVRWIEMNDVRCWKREATK